MLRSQSQGRMSTREDTVMVKRRSTHHSSARLEFWPWAAAAATGNMRVTMAVSALCPGGAPDTLSLTAVNLVANDNEEGNAGTKAVDGDAGLGYQAHATTQSCAHNRLISSSTSPLRHPGQRQQAEHDEAQESLEGRGGGRGWQNLSLGAP